MRLKVQLVICEDDGGKDMIHEVEFAKLSGAPLQKRFLKGFHWE